jgi:hypothetical protein
MLHKCKFHFLPNLFGFPKHTLIQIYRFPNYLRSSKPIFRYYNCLQIIMFFFLADATDVRACVNPSEMGDEPIAMSMLGLTLQHELSFVHAVFYTHFQQLPHQMVTYFRTFANYFYDDDLFFS